MHHHNDILHAIATHIEETTPYKTYTLGHNPNPKPLRDITGPIYPDDRIYLNINTNQQLTIKLENAHLHTLYKLRKHPTTILLYDHDLTDPNSLNQLTEDLTNHYNWVELLNRNTSEPTPHPSNLYTISSPEI